jgi:hypothetical protein
VTVNALPVVEAYKGAAGVVGFEDLRDEHEEI